MLIGIVVEYRLMLKGKKLSQVVVITGLALLIALVGWEFKANPLQFLLAVAIPLLIEGAFLANSESGDTLSESHWVLAQRPLVPFIYGMVSTWVVFLSGWHPLYIAAWAGLMMHFFFQSQDVYRRLWGIVLGAKEE